MMDCPVCGVTLAVAQSGDGVLLTCHTCGGIWLDIPTLEKLAADRQREAEMLARYRRELHEARALELTALHKLSCPRCAAAMMRFEYGGTSCVHIDACREHGIWFDRDELARVMQFVRSGGRDTPRDVSGGSTPPPRPPPAPPARPARDSGSSWTDWFDAWDVFWTLEVIFDWD
jgi:Zn-finger nucleic acid-binding protein